MAGRGTDREKEEKRQIGEQRSVTKREATSTNKCGQPREKERDSRIKIEGTTEREEKRIGTTSLVSCSSILRKSSPKMAGCTKRYTKHQLLTSIIIDIAAR